MQITNPPGQAAPPDTHNSTKGQAPVAAQPFVRGALEHVEDASARVATVLTTSEQRLNTISVPAHGFLRSVLVKLEVDSIAGGTLRADGIAGVIASASFSDIGSSPIITPINGYGLQLINKWFPVGGCSDPAIVNPDALLKYYRLNLEIAQRDALGALPNMDSAARYAVDLSLAPLATAFSTNPTAAPTVTISTVAEAWSPPQVADFGGRPVEPNPPSLGTTQYVSVQRQDVTANTTSINLERRGNLIRGLIIEGRASGQRSDSVLPTRLRFYWDGRELYNVEADYLRFVARERSGQATEAGVLVFDWTHELTGRIGAEMRDQWLRTLTSSRLEIVCEGIAAAGQIKVYTVDVVPAAGANIYMS